MNLLAIDTSTTSCSVALLENNCLLVEEIYTAGKTHSRHLMSMIHRVLSSCDKAPCNLEGIAVTLGPGTFTGLRIGLSTVKGLAAANKTPVVGVSSLEALVYPLYRFQHPIVAMIDARRGEVYHAMFDNCSVDLSNSGTPAIVSSPEAVARTLPNGTILVGSGAVLYEHVFASGMPKVHIADPMQHVIRASSVGLLALDRLNRNDVDSIEMLTPAYIRQSDAQVQVLNKNSGCC